jgi:hypothetical protein
MVRRGFVHPVVAAAAIVACINSATAQSQSAPTLTIAVVGGDSEASRATMKGVEFGLSEARHAARLFRRHVDRANATDCVLVQHAQVLVYAGEPRQAARVAEQCRNNGVVFINALASGDSLRVTCSRFVYHVPASDAMRRAASPSGRVEMWDKSLERFGAGQLNDRYRQAGGEMSSAEWAGWMAVKIAWEAFLRTSDGSASAIADWLSSDAAQFDGHKGAPLSFRSWNHQLRQPLYVIDDDGQVGEVPSLSRPDVAVRDLLDTLGGSQGDRQCE